MAGRKNKAVGKKFSREKLKEYLVTLPVCIIAMDACASAHYWARLFYSYGHEVKLIAAQFVKPHMHQAKGNGLR